MKVMGIYYKYKSTNNEDRIKALLKEQKIWASTYYNLNDPMEWFFESKDSRFDQKLLDEYKGDARICCLSKTKNYGLMWSMYADEHRGICIELEVEDSENIKEDEELSPGYWTKYEVDYKNKPSEIENGYPSVDEVLKVKSPQWNHEQEVRFVKMSSVDCYLDVKINKVYVGCRATEDTKNLIRKIKKESDHSYEIVDLSKSTTEKVNFWRMYNGDRFPDKLKDEK